VAWYPDSMQSTVQEAFVSGVEDIFAPTQYGVVTVVPLHVVSLVGVPPPTQ